jgi:probable phosphoglycerate mutase
MYNDTLYLVRHGETEWNRDGILQGQLDSPLTEQGQRQSYAMGEYLVAMLTDKAVVHIECSHLGRAIASAEIIRNIMGLGKQQLSISEQLAEIHLGEWQGLDTSQIEARWPGQLSKWVRDRWHFTPPGGEDYTQLTQRARQWLAQQRKAPVTVVVTHQQFSNALRGVYAGLSPAEVLLLQHEQHSFFHLHNGLITPHYVRPDADASDQDDGCQQFGRDIL